MKKAIFPLLIALFLVGCDAMQDLQEFGEKQAKVQSFIKDEYGLESQVGWNIHNGVLTQVTVIFYAEEVREKTVATLEEIALKAVSHSFSAEPQAIFIQIIGSTDA